MIHNEDSRVKIPDRIYRTHSRCFLCDNGLSKCDFQLFREKENQFSERKAFKAKKLLTFH
jgi:hypothetical protein